MKDRLTYAGLWMLELFLWFGWLFVLPLTTPLGWIIYYGMFSQYRDFRRGFRAAMRDKGDVDVVDLFLHRQTPLRPRLARYSNGSDDDGSRDLGYVAHHRDLNAATYPPRWECPNCKAQYESLAMPTKNCQFCGGPSWRFQPVETLVSRVP